MCIADDCSSLHETNLYNVSLCVSDLKYTVNYSIAHNSAISQPDELKFECFIYIDVFYEDEGDVKYEIFT